MTFYQDISTTDEFVSISSMHLFCRNVCVCVYVAVCLSSFSSGFSTARLLLHFARLKSGQRLLDFCGGMGTIALEAACCVPHLTAVSSDVSVKACTMAEGCLKLGSSENYQKTHLA